MAKSYLDKDGLLYFWQKIKNVFVTDVTYDSTNKKIQKTKAGSTSDVVTLSTVATSGSYNDLSNKPTIPTLKNVFGKVKVGSTTVEADTTQDTLELAAGDGISLTPDATNDKVTIAGTLATGSKPGMLSSSDFTKLSNIATGAEVNQNAFSNVKVGSTTVAADAKTDTLELVAGTNVTLTPDATNDKVTIAATDTKYSAGTGLSLSGTTFNNTGVTNVFMDTENGLLKETKDGSDSIVTPLTTVALTGSYNDLVDTPTIPTLKNVFGKVKVGSTTVEADTTQDTLELAAGTNITLTPDATNDKVTIATSAEVNQNAFSNVKVGSTTVAADTKTDTLELAAGQSITLTPDATNDKVTIAVDLDSSIVSSAQSNPVTGGAIYTALSGKINTSARGAANGVCPLNANTKIDATYLPSYVDDVIEVYARSGQTALSQNWFATGSASGTVVTPEAGKIYVLMADSGDYAANTQFRWGGSAYVKMADGGVSSITNAEIDTIVAA